MKPVLLDCLGMRYLGQLPAPTEPGFGLFDIAVAEAPTSIRGRIFFAFFLAFYAYTCRSGIEGPGGLLAPVGVDYAGFAHANEKCGSGILFLAYLTARGSKKEQKKRQQP